jgi:hypothetical protein
MSIETYEIYIYTKPRLLKVGVSHQVACGEAHQSIHLLHSGLVG